MGTLVLQQAQATPQKSSYSPPVANHFSRSLNAPTEVVKQIIINIEAGVEVEVTIAA